MDFDAGFVTSDGGGLLLGRMDRKLSHVQRFSKAFSDYRNSELIEHSKIELLRQRVYGIALGYEDLNDHESLKKGSARYLYEKEYCARGEMENRIKEGCISIF